MQKICCKKRGINKGELKKSSFNVDIVVCDLPGCLENGIYVDK